jgi:hypothetical protein
MLFLGVRAWVYRLSAVITVPHDVNAVGRIMNTTLVFAFGRLMRWSTDDEYHIRAFICVPVIVSITGILQGLMRVTVRLEHDLAHVEIYARTMVRSGHWIESDCEWRKYSYKGQDKVNAVAICRCPMRQILAPYMSLAERLAERLHSRQYPSHAIM